MTKVVDVRIDDSILSLRTVRSIIKKSFPAAEFPHSERGLRYDTETGMFATEATLMMPKKSDFIIASLKDSWKLLSQENPHLRHTERVEVTELGADGVRATVTRGSVTS